MVSASQVEDMEQQESAREILLSIDDLRVWFELKPSWRFTSRPKGKLFSTARILQSWIIRACTGITPT